MGWVAIVMLSFGGLLFAVCESNAVPHFYFYGDSARNDTAKHVSLDSGNKPTVLLFLFPWIIGCHCQWGYAIGIACPLSVFSLSSAEHTRVEHTLLASKNSSHLISKLVVRERRVGGLYLESIVVYVIVILEGEKEMVISLRAVVINLTAGERKKW